MSEESVKTREKFVRSRLDKLSQIASQIETQINEVETGLRPVLRNEPTMEKPADLPGKMETPLADELGQLWSRLNACSNNLDSILQRMEL